MVEGIMVAIMVVIQMVPGFYIGSRSVNLLLQGDTGKQAIAEATVDDVGQIIGLKLTEGGYGLVGLVAAGMIGAILSSLDSMMNSAATIFTFDILQALCESSCLREGADWGGPSLYRHVHSGPDCSPRWRSS